MFLIQHKMSRNKIWAAALAATCAVALSPASAASEIATTLGSRANVRVIVQATSTRAAAAAVLAVHGRVTTTLEILKGVAAVVPSARLSDLARLPAVQTVTNDAHLRVQSIQPSTPGSRPASVYGAAVRGPRAHRAGWKGQGVTVALLDTGIASSPDLAGRVLPVTDEVTGAISSCENLSGEPTCRDGYGHGTFMAGIIAGNGTSSGGRFRGIAPRAKLVSIKVGASDGSVDVSNVLAGIQWAVAFRDRYDIKVLNLSLGTNSARSWRVDPLNYAVERAWAAGITVVVSAGNRGPVSGTISKPADDPWVITVGAVDDNETEAVSDDTSAAFTSRGPTLDGLRKPDVVAPGARLVSLRSVGSTLDRQFPSSMAGAYHQGSGTSMAAAVVSGVAAVVLSARPGMSPDRLKYALSATARRVAVNDPQKVGSGIVDAYEAAFAPPGLANRGLGGSIDRADLGGSGRSALAGGTRALQTAIRGSRTLQQKLSNPVALIAGDGKHLVWSATPRCTARWYSAQLSLNRKRGHNWEGVAWNWMG